nr:protein LAZ1-like [Coffea arabica]
MQNIIQSFCFNWLKSSYSPPTWAAAIGGVFVIVTLILSIYLLFEHLSAYKHPEEQKFLIGVILMVPCYAVESFVSLLNPSISVDVEILRDGYESFAMYCFGRYLVACLGGEDCLPHNSCRYPYMAVVLNFSQSWALYCLVQFYSITKVELAHIKPLAKFLTFKSIVFLTWWQGIFIALFYDLGLLRSPIAQALQFQSSVQDFIICIEMGIASVVHLYVFPAKPYELMEDYFPGSVSVLGDYIGEYPVDPEEVRDSERPTKLRLPQPEVNVRSGMTIKESVKDVFVGAGEFIVNDVKFTVTQAVEPMEKGISHINKKLHKISQNMKKHEKERRTKDDSCIDPPSRRVIRGIDDPLLNGSISDTGSVRKKKHRRKSGYTSAESGGESSSDHSFGDYQIRGRRWVTRD